MEDKKASFPLLSRIAAPEDLKSLSENELATLSTEMRGYLLEALDRCGGHFGANLGCVELAIALHYVFDAPQDHLIWDVGHQAYPHKILTGRRDRIHTVKQKNGLAPFPHRGESLYDCFGTGHSSTSISAATGFACADAAQNRDHHSVAIIGDGGLTGGMAFEALNHAGSVAPKNLLVILNDNEMSISQNVGALTHYFSRILSGKIYATLREGSKKVLDRMPPIKQLAKRTETHMKGIMMPGALFEELGFHYFGPFDGHDLPLLIRTLQNLKRFPGPRLLHVITTKGKGYQPAEQNPILFHAVSPGYYSKKPSPAPSAPAPLTYSDVFGKWLCATAQENPRLEAITPAMCEGSGMVEFSQRFAARYHDVGIAEQHSLTFAAGLACGGRKPVVAIYSTFLQRAYDQLIHDIALQNLDVTFAIDRAGVVGPDGPTHAGSFDLSYLRCVPHLILMAPSNGQELIAMLNTAYHHEGPAAVRYPRRTCPETHLIFHQETLEIGRALLVRSGQKIAILAFGTLVLSAQLAADTLNASLVNMRFIKPLDKAMILQMATTHDLIVTLEENAIAGGAGSAVHELLAAQGIVCPLLHLGLPDRFLEHAKPDEVLQMAGLTPLCILEAIEARLSLLRTAQKSSVPASTAPPIPVLETT